MMSPKDRVSQRAQGSEMSKAADTRDTPGMPGGPHHYCIKNEIQIGRKCVVEKCLHIPLVMKMKEYVSIVDVPLNNVYIK